MRIGEFAARYDMSVSSVRYYVNMGLLIPQTSNNRYVFGQRDIQDMNFIHALKHVGITLEDILQIINTKRINAELGKRDNSEIKLALLRQKEYLQQAIYSYEEKILSIDRLIEELNTQEIEQLPTFKNGIDLGFLNYLCCPVCGSSLNIIPEIIHDNQFVNATISCKCGYTANVQDGIMSIHTPVNMDLNDHQRDVWCYDYLQPHEMNSIIKICDWMYPFLIEKAKADSIPLLIMENYASNYCFIFDQAKRLPINHYYVLTDINETVIKEYKQRIEKANPELKVLYIAGSNLQLPLKERIVDVTIDLFNNTFFGNYNQTFYTEHIKHYLKMFSLILGSYTYIKPMSKSLQEYQKAYPDHHKGNRLLSAFKKDLKNNNVQIVEEHSDQPMKTSTLSWHCEGDDLSHWSYAAVLQPH